MSYIRNGEIIECLLAGVQSRLDHRRRCRRRGLLGRRACGSIRSTLRELVGRRMRRDGSRRSRRGFISLSRGGSGCCSRGGVLLVGSLFQDEVSIKVSNDGTCMSDLPCECSPLHPPSCPWVQPWSTAEVLVAHCQ